MSRKYPRRNVGRRLSGSRSARRYAARSSSTRRSRPARSSVCPSGMSRGRFLRNVGLGAGAVAGTTMMESGVAHATIPEEGPTLQDVKDYGKVRVGLGPEPYGQFLYFDPLPPVHNKPAPWPPLDQWKGFDLEMGKLVATAIFGDWDTHIEYKLAPNWGGRWDLLEDNEVDVLFSVATWTTERDLAYDIAWGPMYYVTDVSIAYIDPDVTNPYDANDWGTVAGTTGVDLVEGQDKNAVLVVDMDEALAKFGTAFDVFVTDRDGVEWLKASYTGPGEVKIWNVPLSLDTLATVVRNGDDHWHEIVYWAVNLTILAEGWGWSSDDYTGQLTTDKNNKDSGKWVKAKGGWNWQWNLSLAKRVLLGGLINMPPKYPQMPDPNGPRYGIDGLDEDWAYNVIRIMGNYFEIYYDFWGDVRGYNKHALDGGLFVPPE